MAKELVILSWCDVCQDEDTRTEGESYTLGIGNGKLLELELCERHAKPVREVIALLTEHGKPPSDALPVPTKRSPYKKREPKATSPAATPQVRGGEDHPLPCLLCDETFQSRGLFEVHLARDHQLPITPGKSLQPLFGTICPECGDDRRNMRALSIHLTQFHKVKGHIAYAFDNSSDPHGVVAEVRKRMQDMAGTLL